jgi:chemotaxis protein methyltransferase CheR
VLLERAVVGETYFFRHPEHFAALAEAAAAAAERGRPYRSAWSVGCASGEEAWSLALVLGPHARGGLTVVGSDVSPRSLERARAGRYSAWSVRGSGAPPGLRASAEGWEVPESVRAGVAFARLNLAADALVPPPPLPAQVDVIFCRNVLVYLLPERVEAVLAALGAALAEDGLLVLSAMDAPSGVPGLEPAADGWPGLFTRARPAPRPQRPPTARALAASHARPPSLRTRIAPARALADAGDLDGALQRCQQLGDEPEALLLAASIHAERAELEHAQQLLHRVLAAQPEHPGANLHLALVAARRGPRQALESARARLLHAVGAQPDDAPFGYEGLTAGHVRQILASLPPPGGALP